MNKKTIFIVDDDLEVCESLRSLFEPIKATIQTYTSAETFLSQHHSSHAGCLVLDIKMPGMSGIELLEQLSLRKHALSTIVISGYNEIPVIVKAIQFGAVDFLLKPIDEQHLLKILHYYLEKNPQQHSIFIPPKKNILTKREQEVMNLILDGKFNKEIAHELTISISTVEAHRSRIMDKFRAKNLASLIKNYFHISDCYYK